MPAQLNSDRYLPGLVKRTFDVAVATLSLPMAIPIILIMAVAIRIESKGNPFFMQTRVRLGGKPFSMWKMRTLYSDKFGILEWHHELTLGDDRITRVGRFLRRTKLDELPQLFHVVSGKMSLVGPRPDIPEQVAQYSDEQCERLNAKPGVTGVSQVSGNTFLGWPARIELDRWYINNAALRLDMRILWWTFAAIWRGESRAFDDLGALAKTRQQQAVHQTAAWDALDYKLSNPQSSKPEPSNPQPLAPVE